MSWKSSHICGECRENTVRTATIEAQQIWNSTQQQQHIPKEVLRLRASVIVNTVHRRIKMDGQRKIRISTTTTNSTAESNTSASSSSGVSDVEGKVPPPINSDHNKEDNIGNVKSSNSGVGKKRKVKHNTKSSSMRTKASKHRKDNFGSESEDVPGYSSGQEDDKIVLGKKPKNEITIAQTEEEKVRISPLKTRISNRRRIIDDDEGEDEVKDDKEILPTTAIKNQDNDDNVKKEHSKEQAKANRTKNDSELLKKTENPQLQQQKPKEKDIIKKVTTKKNVLNNKKESKGGTTIAPAIKQIKDSEKEPVKEKVNDNDTLMASDKTPSDHYYSDEDGNSSSSSSCRNILSRNNDDNENEKVKKKRNNKNKKNQQVNVNQQKLSINKVLKDTNDDQNKTRKNKKKGLKSCTTTTSSNTNNSSDNLTRIRTDDELLSMTMTKTSSDTGNNERTKTLDNNNNQALPILLLWKRNEPVPYNILCHCFYSIEKQSGRLIIQVLFTELLRKIILLASSSPSSSEKSLSGVSASDAKGEVKSLSLDDTMRMTKKKQKVGSSNQAVGAATSKDDDNTLAGAAAVDTGDTGGSKSSKIVEPAPPSLSFPTSSFCTPSASPLPPIIEDLLDVLYLACNSVAPAYKCVELGVGDAILIKAIGEAYGTNPAMVKQNYEKEGDLGTVASSAKGKQRTLGFGVKPKPLLVREVLAVFRQIATTSGAQSQRWKVDKIKGLLVRAVGNEAKYIIRGLQGRLRIGLAQSTVLISLAHALLITRPKGVKDIDDDRLKRIANGETSDVYPDHARKLCDKKTTLDEKLESAVNVIKKAYSELPSFDALVEAAVRMPLHEMHLACSLRPGIPVEPMLAKPTKSVQEVLKRLSGQRFTCEYKYDGERAQVHMTPDGTTKVFSRNLLDTSEKFPEVPLYVKEACITTKVSSFVLDTEVVAYNRATNQFVPFQVLSTRKKTVESAKSANVQIIVQAFDLMYINGESLLDRSLTERREKLKKLFLPIGGKFQYAVSLDHKEEGDTAIIEEFLEEAVKGQCEGLMIKTLDENANYEPSRRSLNWLKLKKDYLEGLGDSVDLVPIGAYHGRGKRTGVYGAYLLACYDEESEEFQSVCKIGTGFSEEDLKTLSESLNSHIIEKSSQYKVADQLKCDVWFDAVQVWEVKAADLSKSSMHKGAIGKTGETGRGIGLRFPRFERLRTDKRPEQATSSDQILDMYYAQDSVFEGQDDNDDEGI